ncbi:MAG: hypothetical protein EOL98_15805 [Negativicutes bacterium]|nr:hypothetical protein [Negativicutes bacterium]
MILNPRTDILPDSQKKLWPLLTEVPKDFVLYGGTAVALRYGHRQSVDFDFFSSYNDSDVRNTIGQLDFIKQYAIDINNPEFISVSSGSQVIYKLQIPDYQLVQVTFVRDSNFIKGTMEKPSLTTDNKIYIASPIDLMATKINALKNRNSVKDYIDVSTMIKNGISFKRGIAVAIALNESKIYEEIEIFNRMLEGLREPEKYTEAYSQDIYASDQLKTTLKEVMEIMVPEAEKVNLADIKYKITLRQNLSYKERIVEAEEYDYDR